LPAAGVESGSTRLSRVFGTDEEMSDYRNLEVWQKSRALVVEVYQLTKGFPRSEMFGLTSQMRRAAISIVSNIAEGNGRWTSRDRGSFVITARGSTQELETQIFVAEDLEFLSPEDAHGLRKAVNEIGRMLNGLLRYYSKQRTPATGNQPPATSVAVPPPSSQPPSPCRGRIRS
jgi:four helix bundle protein